MKYLFRPIMYLLAGGSVMAILIKLLITQFSMMLLLLFGPMIAITLFMTIMGLVNVWVQYRTWRDEGYFRNYTLKELMRLYLSSFMVVAIGLTLAFIFYLMIDVLPDQIAALVSSWSLVYYLLCAVLTIASLLSIVRGEQLQEIRLRNAQSENALLKSQLNPHFLYNTLNNIDALIWTAPDKASDAVCQLSGLMRYFTYSARQTLVNLDEEVEHLQQLINLQRLRMLHPESLSFQCALADKGIRIAPLLLVPLIENTFKHCGNLEEEQAIVIHLSADAESLVLTTDNNLREVDPTAGKEMNNDKNGKGGSNNDKNSYGSSKEKDGKMEISLAKKSGGIGLSSLRRRLDLLYAGHYAFSAEKVGDRYKVRLELRF